MTRVLMLGLDAQVNHGYQNMSRLVVNSESLLKVGLKERAEITNGDLLPPTTSGITTTVPKLSVKILDMVKVQLKKEREIKTTERHSTLKLDIEDVLKETLTSFNAESMVDQTTRTTLLKLL
jgi:hypothetical protein